MLGKLVFLVLRSEVLGESRQQVHVLREVARNIRLHHLEDTALAAAPFWVEPRKPHHGADARLAENFPLDLYGMTLQRRSELLHHGAMHFLGIYVVDAIL